MRTGWGPNAKMGRRQTWRTAAGPSPSAARSAASSLTAWLEPAAANTRSPRRTRSTITAARCSSRSALDRAESSSRYPGNPCASEVSRQSGRPAKSRAQIESIAAMLGSVPSSPG